jgi:hypothetical protein
VKMELMKGKRMCRQTSEGVRARGKKSHAQGGWLSGYESEEMARVVFSSGTSQLTVAVGEWCASDEGDKADVGGNGAGRRKDLDALLGGGSVRASA